MSEFDLSAIILTIFLPSMVYRPTKNTPISEETTLENAKKWLNIIRFGESGSVIQLQDDCEYRVAEILENPTLLKKFLGPYYRKYLLLYIPYEISMENTFKTALDNLCHSRNLPRYEGRSLTEYLKHIAHLGYDIGLFLSRLSPTLDDPTFRELLYLEKILEKAKNLSLICFFEKDVTSVKYDFLTDKCSLLFDNVIKYPLYGPSDSRQFIKYQTELWDMNIKRQLSSKIIYQCGGYLWLISHLLRFIRDNGGEKIVYAFKDDLLLKKLDAIWHKLSDDEQSLLVKTVAGTLDDTDKKTHSFAYLRKIRLIKDNNSLGLPLLKLLIDRRNKLKKLILKEGSIYFEREEINGNLTAKEKILLSFLLKNSGKIVSRNELAKAIWQENWEEKYSDWAIDRLAYRLRRKLSTLGIDSSLFKTAKRKGFIFG